jgi:hypothetical protein
MTTGIPIPTFEQMLEEWLAVAKTAKTTKAREMELRTILFTAAFPAHATPGVAKITLADGRELKGTYKLTRSVDEPALGAVLEELRTANDAAAFLIFGTKPTLSMTHYNAFDVDSPVRKIADKAIIVKPSAVGLEVT